ncbi:MmcQ/YjbR family DNA-binding protein [Micromonospora sp. SL1-18]|uniref:MmcQ/YjbR family DNA-binding protein n=1 Tax=Micromonospora sp. SL1-18 TaxID=3399128 RepID=UPI003A4D416D
MARGDELLDRVRRICAAFPDVAERPSHGTPTWFVSGRKSFVQLWPDGHHRDEFPHLWCAASPGAQEELIATNSRVFFRPPYVGHRGWVGVRLDQDASWAEVAELCEDAYRAVAPKRLLAQLDTAPQTN